MKAVVTAVGESSTKLVYVDRQQTCEKERRCQAYQIVESRHPPCGSPDLGGRK